MKGGRLEVFLVSSKGIKNTSRIVKPSYYVAAECGTQVVRSKTSKGSRIAGNHREIYWNEKLTFEFPISECENLIHLKLKILDKGYFGDGKFAGETIVDLKMIILEGNERGFIEVTPRPYNVVLSDGTYKGELKIGLRFIPNTDIHLENNQVVVEDGEPKKTICKSLMNLWKISWWRFSNICKRRNKDDKLKEI